MQVEFQGALVTSDDGLLLVRELGERLRFGELIERHLKDAFICSPCGAVRYFLCLALIEIGKSNPARADGRLPATARCDGRSP